MMQVNLVVVSDSVGVEGVIRYTDYLVSGAVVVSQAFLVMLHKRKGRLTEQDWETVPQWMYFAAGKSALVVWSGYVSR